MRDVWVCDLGRMDYEPAWLLQKRIQERLIRAKRTPVGGEGVPHVLLLVEHPPVYTLGTNGHMENLLVDEPELNRRGAVFVKTDRGGDITFHGPGQIVGYPLLDLGHFYTDMHRYLRDLEEVIIRTCAEYGLTGGRVEGRTGVWIGPDHRGPERKICAMGIRCSRWVTMHGFALNVNTDLDFFSWIIPCGITDRSVTSLAAETGQNIDVEEVRRRLIRHFANIFQADVTLFEGEKAMEQLEFYLAGAELRVARE